MTASVLKAGPRQIWACHSSDVPRSFLVLWREIANKMAKALAKDVAAVMMTLHDIDTSMGPRSLWMARVLAVN